MGKTRSLRGWGTGDRSAGRPSEGRLRIGEMTPPSSRRARGRPGAARPTCRAVGTSRRLVSGRAVAKVNTDPLYPDVRRFVNLGKLRVLRLSGPSRGFSMSTQPVNWHEG